MDEEIKNLLAAGHIERIGEISDEMFIQPVVITVKKDRSVKIALEARSLNDAILKDKSQLPNLKSLMENVAETINGKQEGDVWFTSLDTVYAHGHTVLHPETVKLCNFHIIGGKTTCTYAIKTSYYGLKTRPPEFQKIMDKILHKTHSPS